MITKTDAVDRVFPMNEGRTEVFSLPVRAGGCRVSAYDSPAKGTAYRWGKDYQIEDGGERDGRVRIAAVPGGALEGKTSVYVLTAGNIWREEATVEIYGEEESDG